MALPKTQLPSIPTGPSPWEGVPWGEEVGAPIPFFAPLGDLPFEDPFAPPTPAPAKGIGIDAFYQALSKLPGYEHRKEQYDLTVAIAQTLENKLHLAAQAPTGTGKSYAVGGGIIAAFLGTGKRAIVATANNSLLEQYASKDLPFLQSLFPALKWARAKGKGNYACIDKGEKLFGQQALFNQPEALKRLQGWYDSTATGDKEEIGFELPDGEWSKINADDTCTGKKCAFYKECHYFKAKNALNEADIIVTNFDLVLLEAFNPVIQLFPNHDAIIFDEAHQLEDKAIGKLEASLTGNQVAGFLNKARKQYNVEDETLLGRVSDAAGHLFSAYRGLLQQGQEKQNIIPSQQLLDLTHVFQQNMKNLADAIWRHKTPDGTRERMAQEKLLERLDEAGHAAMAAVTNDANHVSWVEMTPNKSDIRVVTCPFRVAVQMNQAFFSNPDISIICLSATLGLKGQKSAVSLGADGKPKSVALFEQFRKRIGMANCGEFDCPSPFNYTANAVLYLPKPPEGVTEPKHIAFLPWQNQQILDLVNLSRGRALVLTTSNAALKQITGFLTRACNLPVKAQGPEMPNSKLIEWFKATENAVMVGTSSFWEGISVEGDDLKLVIMDKLPFAPHMDPIQKAREAWYKADPKRKNKWYQELQIYPAAIKLMQGFGRLIRTKTDTGVVAILDPRLTHANYRNTFLNSLPNAYKTTLLHDSRLVEKLK